MFSINPSKVFCFFCFFFFFSTFDEGKLGEIRRHQWKERLKISKIAKFESELLKTNKDIASQSREILQTFVWWGEQTCLPSPPPIIQTSADFAELYLRSRKTFHFQI